MLHSNLVVLSTAAVLLGAGVVVGRLSDQWTPHRHPPSQQQPDRSHNWLSDQLKLTPEQHQQMDAIWTEAQKQINKAFETRRELSRQREQAIHDLLTPQELAAYDKINADFRTAGDDLYKQRQALMQDANSASRALLDPDQQKKWDLLTKEMRDRRGSQGGGPVWGGPGGRMRGPGGHDGMDDHGGGHHERNGDLNDGSTTRPAGGAEEH